MFKETRNNTEKQKNKKHGTIQKNNNTINMEQYRKSIIQ
jgi:hypothetical protein